MEIIKAYFESQEKAKQAKKALNDNGVQSVKIKEYQNDALAEDGKKFELIIECQDTLKAHLVVLLKKLGGFLGS